VIDGAFGPLGAVVLVVDPPVDPLAVVAELVVVLDAGAVV
jgi:hypothetical protein